MGEKQWEIRNGGLLISDVPQRGAKSAIGPMDVNKKQKNGSISPPVQSESAFEPSAEQRNNRGNPIVISTPYKLPIPQVFLGSCIVFFRLERGFSPFQNTQWMLWVIIPSFSSSPNLWFTAQDIGEWLPRCLSSRSGYQSWTFYCVLLWAI